MREWFSGPIPWLFGGLALTFAAAFLWIAGSAVVVDETDGVTSAVVITSGGTEQPLRQLWSGYFYAVPRIEGTIEIRCHNGVRRQIGYVTGHMHTKIRVVGAAPCERMVEAN